MMLFRDRLITENIITFCIITSRVTEFYYILRQKLLHFALTSLLHFVRIITFCGVTVFFPGDGERRHVTGTITIKIITINFLQACERKNKLSTSN